MEKNSVDNVTVIFVAFKNFENKMKDPNFVYNSNTKCKIIPDQIDFSRPNKNKWNKKLERFNVTIFL